jgi:hypothetical protein
MAANEREARAKGNDENEVGQCRHNDDLANDGGDFVAYTWRRITHHSQFIDKASQNPSYWHTPLTAV